MRNRIEEWLPHRYPIKLIDELIKIDQDSAECVCHVGESDRPELFHEPDGSLPSVLLIEMMAQAIGTWAGYFRSETENLSDVGFLLSVRGCKFFSDVTPQETLTIKVKKIIQDNNIASFDGEVYTKEKKVLIKGKITVYQPTKFEYDKLFNGKANK